MKTFTTLLLFAVVGLTTARATHITGGEITYTYSTGDIYEITLKIYRDCGPDNALGTGFDEPAHIGIYAEGALYTTLDADLFSATISLVPANISNPCLVTPPDVCIEECIYTAEVQLEPSITGYDLVYVRCCRSPAIVNLLTPEAQGMTCNTHIPGTAELSGHNSSAVFTNLPPTLLCTSFPFAMDHSATDEDGDSLVYEMCMPLLGADEFTPYPDPYPTYEPIDVVWQDPYTFSNPIAGAPPFQINSQTGWFTGTPTTSGRWVYAVCVSEYRDGALINVVKRDYMVQILICEQVVTAAITSPQPCQGLTINFNNNSQNANNYAWDFGIENSDTDVSTEAEPIFTYPNPGEYTLTLIAQPGAPCADTLTTQLAVNELLEATMTLENSTCSNGAMQFNYILDGNYSSSASILWDFPIGSIPGSSTSENPLAFSTSNTGNNQPVEVTVEDFGCEIELTQTIDVPQMPEVTIIPPIDPCVGTTVNFNSTITGATSQTWDFGVAGNADTSDEEDPTYTYANYGTYTVVLTAENDEGCTDSETLEWAVFDPNPLVMDFGVFEPLPCSGDSNVVFVFTGTGATSITWITGDGVTGSGDSFNYVYDAQGNYTGQLIIENDLCDAVETASFDVFYSIDVPLLDIRMPNVITPNNDNKNTFFRPFEKNEAANLTANSDIFDYIDEYSLQVYNRWGKLIFENNGSEAWNGTYDSTPVAEGVYYYIVKFREICSGKKVDQAGHVTVMK